MPKNFIVHLFIVSNMSQDISHLPDPTNRTASDWVDYFKIMYSASVQGESVSANGRSVTLPSMTEIKKELLFWQNEMRKEAIEANNTSGESALAPITLKP